MMSTRKLSQNPKNKSLVRVPLYGICTQSLATLLIGSQAHSKVSRNTVANQMTPAQIAEAERLAAEWKPRDCGAEDRTAKSTK